MYIIMYYSLPQLGSNEDVLSLDHALLEALLQALSNLSFVLVSVGTVDVVISLLQSNFNSCCDLSRLRLPRPAKNEHKLIETR